MHSVELLEQALIAAVRVGYQVREEWTGGSDGGSCEVEGRKMLFIDPALTAAEQLEVVAEALLRDSQVQHIALPVELSDYLGLRKAA